MKIAVFSDIHGNMHALEAVWEDIQRESPDAVYCLGDLVGYGAFPNEVVEFVHSKKIPTIMGNYDEGVGYDLHDCGCVYKDPEKDRLGKLSLLWTRDVTTAANKMFLQSLPMSFRLDERDPHLLLVHGSPRKMNEYLYEDRPQASFERIAKVAGTDILLFGHTHLPYQKQVSNTLFINTGSIGKPKDGDWRAGYVLLTLNRRPTVEFRRVEYDVDAAASAIQTSGLPSYFAEVLIRGGMEIPARTPLAKKDM
jgi:putative phosphoesterase